MGWSRRNLLVVVPLALSLMLLIGSAILIRASQSATAVSLSFDPSRVIGLSFRLGSQGYDDAKVKQFQEDLRDRVATVPGVAASAFTDTFFMFGGTCNVQGVQGAICHAVSPGFFETTGLSVLQGRPFLPSDRAGSSPVAIVNREFVRRNGPEGNPVGRRIQTTEGPVEVVGVANDLSYAQHVGVFVPLPTVYLPLDQSKPLSQSVSGPRLFDMQFLVRVNGNSAAIKKELREAVRAADPALWTRAQTVQEYLDQITGNGRPVIWMVAGLAALVLLMAAVGIYALLAYSVSRRTREIGIRMALGACDSEILMLVMRRTLVLIGWGIACGLAGALALGRILAAVVLKTEPPDVLTCVVVALTLTAASLLASFIPARKALRVNPVEALRSE